MKITYLFGRICSGKSTYRPEVTRIVVSNVVRGIISSATREELQNTLHLDMKIAESIDMLIDHYTWMNESEIIIDGIRQITILRKLLERHPGELVWLEVPVQERKRRYESRKDAKDVESFEIADNKPIELLCQDIFTILKDKLKVINNYEATTES